ncbi:MAG: type II secretion system F family protein [Acidobacteriota bacterium]|nr:type II secretion system F family protein [Acidobacteriota bacterium]
MVFNWEAMDDQGLKVTGTEKAVSAGAVHILLLQRGMQPLEITEKKSFLNFEITKKTVPREEVMNFSRQLAVFMHAGIPIMEALEVIIEETTGKMLKSVLVDVVDKLRNGETFASAAKAHPEAFPNFYVGILESAELTGNLDTVLNQLAEYIDRDVKARAKVTSALIYPAVVAAMSVVTVVILTVFVLPRFEVFFASLNAKLPLVTRMLLGFSSFVGHWWFAILGVIVLLVGGFITMRRTDRGRAQLDTWKLRLPVIGDITQTSILERTCRILSSLLRAGVDLPRSMEVTAESANNVIYRRAIEGIRDDMMQGQGLAEPLARTGLFPGAARQMFRVGEETGTLDTQLEVAAMYYGRELETKVDRATTLFEPAIIIFMGGVVGFVAVALISAMYGIYNQVSVH